jgi:hypothetical protein
MWYLQSSAERPFAWPFLMISNASPSPNVSRPVVFGGSQLPPDRCQTNHDSNNIRDPLNSLPKVRVLQVLVYEFLVNLASLSHDAIPVVFLLAVREVAHRGVDENVSCNGD